MRLPFIHSWAAGLSFTGDSLVWASGTRVGRRLQHLESEDAPSEEDIASALACLAARVKPAQAYVASHLDPLHVRHAVLQGPVFDDETSFEAWLEAEAVRQLPPRTNLADFIVRIQRLEQTDEYTRCLLALASQKAVTQRVALLEEAGLQPLRISSLDAAIGEALTLDHRALEPSIALLIVRPSDATLLQYQEGVLQSFLSLPYGLETTDAVSLLQEVITNVTPMPSRLCVVGTAARHLVDAARDAGLLDGLVHVATLDVLPEDQASVFPRAHLPAAALVLQALYPALEAFNFLEPEVVEVRLQEIEKYEATRAILAVGSVIGVLFLLLMVATVYLGGKKAATEADLVLLTDQVARIEQAHAVVEQLGQDIAQAERLVVERTNIAGVLEGVGRAVPEGLWLEAAVLAPLIPGTSQLVLTGTAFSKGHLAAYLDSLEQASFAHNVRLRYSEGVRAATLYKKTKVLDQTLTRFEIQLDLTPYVHDVEGSP